MAFVSRIGNALTKTSARSNSSLLQAVRYVSSSKLFVGGLSFATDENSLRNAFSHYGDVLDGRSKGFGFITYSTSEDAAAAVTAMDGKELQGRALKVNYANDRAGGIRGGGGSGGGSFTSGSRYDTGGYGRTGGYDGGGYGNSHESGAGGYGSHRSGYAGSGGYSDGARSASNYNNPSGGTDGYVSSAGYSDAATSGSYYNHTYNGGYSGVATGGEIASSYNNVSGHGYAGGNSGYSNGGTGGYVTNYKNASGGKYTGGSGTFRDEATSDHASNYNNTSGGGKYAGRNHGYGDGANDGYATNNASSTNYNNFSGGGYGSHGSYDTTGNSDGNTAGYRSPNIYGAVKDNTRAGGNGTFDESGGGFSSRNSGSADLNNGYTLSRNAVGHSYNSSTSTTGFSGCEASGFGSNKVRYNGQDDLLGEDFFDDKEATGNT